MAPEAADPPEAPGVSRLSWDTLTSPPHDGDGFPGMDEDHLADRGLHQGDTDLFLGALAGIHEGEPVAEQARHGDLDGGVRACDADVAVALGDHGARVLPAVRRHRRTPPSARGAPEPPSCAAAVAPGPLPPPCPPVMRPCLARARPAARRTRGPVPTARGRWSREVP